MELHHNVHGDGDGDGDGDGGGHGDGDGDCGGDGDGQGDNDEDKSCRERCMDLISFNTAEEYRHFAQVIHKGTNTVVLK